MADKSVAITASDLFGLGANFHAQSSTITTSQDWPEVFDADGDYACGSEVNNVTRAQAEYGYCNDTPDIDTDLDTAMTTFGELLNSAYIPDNITVNFTAGEQATVSVTGHNHDSNAHVVDVLNTFDVSGIIPLGSGFGCPNIWTNADTDSSPTSVTVSFTIEHVDKNGADGEHWTGENIRCRVEASAEYIGSPTLTTTDWYIDSEDASDSNADQDTYAISAHRYVDKA